MEGAIFYLREGARLAAVVIGAGGVLAGLFPLLGPLLGVSGANGNLTLGLFTASSLAGVLVKRSRNRDREEVLTWRSITGWAILGGTAMGLSMILLASLFLSGETGTFGNAAATVFGEALGTGAITGLFLSLVTWGWRGPLPDDRPNEV